jgi:hypothetical protein
LLAHAGVSAASYATVAPLDGSTLSVDVDVPGHTAKSSDAQANFNVVTTGYFKTLNLARLAGRDFSDRDRLAAPHVAIVNQLFVDQYMRGGIRSGGISKRQLGAM